jgi:hypothetical protein
MTRDPINSWIEQIAGSNPMNAAGGDASGVQVIHRKHRPVQGNIIVDVAEKIRPIMMKMFAGAKDENGVVLQPARIRAMALDMAQWMVKKYED